MKYETIGAGQYVFKEGDSSNDKFYIILTGRASVILKSDPNVFVGENLEQCSPTRNNSKSSNKDLDFTERTNSAKEDEGSSLTRSASSPNSRRDSPLRKQTSVRKLSAFALSIGRFSSLNKKVREKDECEEDTHKQADQLRESTPRIADGNDKPSHSPKSKKRRDSTKPSFISKDSTVNQLKTEFGFINKEMREGESFGERALSGFGARRSASILANTDCEFIVLTKKDYINIVDRYNKENRFKLEFLKENLPYVNRISSASVLQDYIYIFHTEYFKRGNTVTEEGSKGDKVYILVQGQCKVERRLYLKDTADSAQSNKNVLITSISAPSIIGEEILFGNSNKYKYTVKVSD